MLSGVIQAEQHTHKYDIMHMTFINYVTPFYRLMSVMKVTSAETEVEVAVRYYYLLACKTQEVWPLPTMLWSHLIKRRMCHAYKYFKHLGRYAYFSGLLRMRSVSGHSLAANTVYTCCNMSTFFFSCSLPLSCIHSADSADFQHVVGLHHIDDLLKHTAEA